MKTTLYRHLRLWLGGLVLALCAMVFADIAGWLPEGAPRVILWFQFVPSLLSFSAGGGWLAAGFLLVVLLTVLFGRVYCAMLCPLGVLMDVSARVAGRTGRRRRLPYRPNRPVVRALAVAVCAVGLLAGTAVPLGLLDPYSLFGKIVTTTLRPLAGWAHEGLSIAGLLPPAAVSPVAWGAAGLGLGALVVITAMAVKRGRLWCNTACPVGAVLGLLSRKARFRLRIAGDACIACSMCERVCPAQCIDFRNFKIDHSRCVMCLECVASCRRNGISFRREPMKIAPSAATQSDKEQPASATKPALPNAKRRAALGLALTLPVAALAARRQEGSGGQQRRRGGHGEGEGRGEGRGEGHGEGRGEGRGEPCDHDLTQYNRPPVLPPGSGSLAHFQSHCTACQLCVTHCPEQVLRPSISAHGLAGFMQPYQDFDVSFCSYNCSNCSEICPTGAIQPITVEQRQLVQTGIAEFIRSRCVVKTDGTACGACSEHCPTQAVHMVPWRDGLTIPEMIPDLCIGCGGCEYICPVRPYKAIIVKGLATHATAKPVERGGANIEREMEDEFPF